MGKEVKTAIKYRVSTNQIVGRTEASNEILLRLQLESLPSDVGAVEIEEDHPISTLNEFDRWKVVGQEFQQKADLTLTADKTQIDADGVDEAIITVSPDTAIDLLVNGESVSLAAGETLTLTSDVPTIFNIRVRHLDFYADPIRVEAS